MRYPIFAVISLAAILPACETLNQPLTEGRISPLDTAGTQARARRAATASADRGAVGDNGLSNFYRPGEKVTTSSPSTPFFKKKPAGNTMADRMLPLNEELKFIAEEDSYLKVKTKKGEIGYVPALMVSMPMMDELPEIPELPGIVDLPELPPVEDPGGLPPLPEVDEPSGVSDILDPPPLPDPDEPSSNAADAADKPSSNAADGDEPDSE